jgi:hypothetical protein
MAKLIRSHIECGHRLIGLCLYNTDIGKVIKEYKHYCQPTEEQNFPDNCPLENGIVKEKFCHDGVICPYNSCNNTHKHTYYKNGKRIYPHRKRQDCHYYESEDNCTSLSLINPKCIGVRCGDYLRKVGTSLFIPK